MIAQEEEKMSENNTPPTNFEVAFGNDPAFLEAAARPEITEEVRNESSRFKAVCSLSLDEDDDNNKTMAGATTMRQVSCRKK